MNHTHKWFSAIPQIASLSSCTLRNIHKETTKRQNQVTYPALDLLMNLGRKLGIRNKTFWN